MPKSAPENAITVSSHTPIGSTEKRRSLEISGRARWHNGSYTHSLFALAGGGIRSPRNDRVVHIRCHPSCSREPGLCNFPEGDVTPTSRASFITWRVHKYSTLDVRVTPPPVGEMHHVSGHIGTDRSLAAYSWRGSVTRVLRMLNLRTCPLFANGASTPCRG